MIATLHPQVSHQNNAENKNLESSDEKNAPLEGENLLQAIRRQIEFYFSPPNIQNDGFLVSKMDANGCVPIPIIAHFAKVRALTNDFSMIEKALEESNVCAVTPQGIRQKMRAERTTIILREIPSDTPSEKVCELFEGEGMMEVKSVRSDVGDTWFVTCHSEKDAMNNILALRNKKFNGKPIKSRLKGENILRSFYPVPIAAETPNFSHLSMNPGNFNSNPEHSEIVIPEQMPAYGFQYINTLGMYPNTQDLNFQSMGYVPNKVGTGQKNGPIKNFSGNRRQKEQSFGSGKGKDEWYQRSSSGKVKGGGKGKFRGENGDVYRKGKKGHLSPNHEERKDKPQEVLLNATNFPPLLSKGDISDNSFHSSSTKEPVINKGFNGKYINYKSDEILNIVQGMSSEDVAKISFEPKSHPLVMDNEPHPGLILRQRSISIEEVREQLRKGKPVHRESTLPSHPVDYSSLMFGDVNNLSAASGINKELNIKDITPNIPSNEKCKSAASNSISEGKEIDKNSHSNLEKEEINAKLTEKVATTPVAGYAAALLKSPAKNVPAAKKQAPSSHPKNKDKHEKGSDNGSRQEECAKGSNHKNESIAHPKKTNNYDPSKPKSAKNSEKGGNHNNKGKGGSNEVKKTKDVEKDEKVYKGKAQGSIEVSDDSAASSSRRTFLDALKSPIVKDQGKDEKLT